MPLKDREARNAYNREWRARRKQNEPLRQRKKRKRVDIAARFLRNLKEDPETGCLLWVAPIVHSSGLPVIGRGGRDGGNVLGNRLALELAGIEVPAGYRVGSKCGNKRCVRVEHLTINPPLAPVAERFPLLVGPPTESGCLEWLGSKNEDGYGFITTDNGKTGRAHRVALQLSGVTIPPGMVVLHSCDNPACVNVAHLSVGTKHDNSIDMARKGRGSRGPLPYGVARSKKEGRYQARLNVRKGGRKSLGTYNTIEAAAAVAKVGRDRHYGIISPEPENPYEGAQWDDYAQ